MHKHCEMASPSRNTGEFLLDPKTGLQALPTFVVVVVVVHVLALGVVVIRISIP